jgi:hypothetical protein
MFVSTEAIKANPLVNYCYVVTKINLIYDFQKNCNKDTKLKIIYTVYNDHIDPIIKTVFYNKNTLSLIFEIRLKNRIF